MIMSWYGHSQLLLICAGIHWLSDYLPNRLFWFKTVKSPKWDISATLPVFPPWWRSVHYNDVTRASWRLNPRQFHPLFKSSFRLTSKENIKSITCPLWGELPVTDGFPSQWLSNVERVFMSWLHHECQKRPRCTQLHVFLITYGLLIWTLISVKGR